MPELLRRLFSADGFMPHGHCYFWNPGVVWLHVVSDGLIAASYMTIPFTLTWFIRRRRDLPFPLVFWAFGLFIVSCGMTHVMEICTLWTPVYWLSGTIKAITAATSVTTAVILVRLLPEALKIPSPALLREAHARLAVTEARFRAATEQMKDAFYIFDSVLEAGAVTNLRIVEANAAGLFRLGRTREATVGQLYTDVYPRARESGLLDRFIRVVTTGESYDDEVRLNAPSHALEWVHLRAVSLGNGLAVTSNNITDRRKSERERELLLKEIHHRVKNNLQMISSLLKLHAEQVTDPAAQVAFHDSQDRVRSIALLHEQLYQSTSLAEVDVGSYAEALIHTLLRANARGEVALTIDGGGFSLPMDSAVPFGLILNELVTNCLKHGFARGGPWAPRLHVSMHAIDADLELVVTDNGPGFAAETEPTKSKTLGMHLILALASQMEGTMRFQSVDGAESRFRFPNPARRSNQ